MGGWLRLVRYIPDLVRLLVGLMLEPRVWWGAKLVFLLGVAYLALPTDLLSDWVPFAGMVDDLFFFLLCAIVFLSLVPRDVMDEHLYKLRERNKR